MLESLRARLSTVLPPDPNAGADGKYEIHSLYLDDVKNRCARGNDSGVSERFKYRIRYYGDDVGTLHLERKEKYNGRCHKDQCVITPEEYGQLVSGDAAAVFWNTENEILKRFCVCSMTGGYQPKAIIDYERWAYVEENAHIRITLDKNISVSGEVDRFLEGEYQRIPLQERNIHVLEVKFDNILPGYIRHMITDKSLVRTSFSKYYLGRVQLQKMGGII